MSIFCRLGECDTCGLSRLKSPMRNAYEENIIQKVRVLHPNTSDQLIITEFGSGGLFQTFVVINKLVALGYTNIRLNLLDILYQDIINEYKNMPADEQQKRLLDFDGILHAAQMIPIHSARSSLVNAIQDIIDNNEYNNMFVAFLKWFNGLDINLELVLYANAYDYIDDCNNNPFLKSDIITAIDYWAGSVEDLSDIVRIFERLVQYALKDRGTVIAEPAIEALPDDIARRKEWEAQKFDDNE